MDLKPNLPAFFRRFVYGFHHRHDLELVVGRLVSRVSLQNRNEVREFGSI